MSPVFFIAMVALGTFGGFASGFFLARRENKKGGKKMGNGNNAQQELDLAEQALKAAFVHLKKARKRMSLKEEDVYEEELHSLTGK